MRSKLDGLTLEQRAHVGAMCYTAMECARDELLAIIRDALPEIRHAATAEARRNKLVGGRPRTDQKELLKRAMKALNEPR